MMMNNDILDTRGKILQVAIDIVGLKGEVTIREITEEAGVNVSAINYYFGNKNNLLKEVENHYSVLLYDMQYKILMNNELSCRDKLIKWASNLIGFMFKFPALVALIVNIATEDQNYNPVLIQKIYLNKELQDIVEEMIRESTGIDDKKVLNYKYLQVFSGILGPVVTHLVTDKFGKNKNILDINNPDELNEYIEILIDSVLI